MSASSAAPVDTDSSVDMPVVPPWWQRSFRWTQTSPKEATHAEKGLLSLVQGPGLSATNVPVGPGRSDWLHTVHNRPLPPGAPSPSFTTAGQGTVAAHGGPPFVLMPGYGAGVGFFWRNFGPLASAVRLYAVDWLGTGLSGRPRWMGKTREETEDFFINSLAAWRQKAGIENEKMVLVGHSLGGYLSAAYALKHPEHVQHLVLVCPAGVPKAPEDWQQRFVTGQSGVRSTLFRAAKWAWEAGITPHSVIRSLGPWGPRICENYVVRRFAYHGDGLTDKEVSNFQRYFYNIIAQPGSGEHALRHLLAPGAFAHVPLVQRLKELKVPVTFIYGEADWMRPEHAVELCQDLKKERKPLNSSDLHVEIIKDAGHFAFIDQPDQFNQALLDACSQYLGKPAVGIPVSQDADSTVWGAKEPEPRPAAA